MALTGGKVVVIVSGIVIFLLHSTIIFFILLNRDLRQKKSNQFLVLLSIGHALSGFSIATILTSRYMDVLIFPSYVLASLALTIFTIDRCLMIRWPFRYAMLPKGFHIFLISFSVVVTAGALVQQILNITKDDNEKVENKTSVKIFLFGVLTISLILLIPNVFVFTTLKKHKKSIRSLRVSSKKPNESPAKNNRISKRREIQAFYTCFGCAITYVLFWLPTIIIKMMEYYYSGWKVNNSYFQYAISFSNLNPISDAIVFCWFNAAFRRKFKRIIRQTCNCSTQEGGNRFRSSVKPEVSTPGYSLNSLDTVKNGSPTTGSYEKSIS